MSISTQERVEGGIIISTDQKYILYILVWLVISLITIQLFKSIPKKMKEVADPRTKNSLYTILIFIGIPMLMVSVLTPIVFIIGDKNLGLTYEIIWGGLCLAFAFYFVLKQRSK